MILPKKAAQSAVYLIGKPSLQPSPTSEHSIHPYLIPEQSLTTRTTWEQPMAHLNTESIQWHHLVKDHNLRPLSRKDCRPSLIPLPSCGIPSVAYPTKTN